jgi:hypothetical protein
VGEQIVLSWKEQEIRIMITRSRTFVKVLEIGRSSSMGGQVAWLGQPPNPPALLYHPPCTYPSAFTGGLRDNVAAGGVGPAEETWHITTSALEEKVLVTMLQSS